MATVTQRGKFHRVQYENQHGDRCSFSAKMSKTAANDAAKHLVKIVNAAQTGSDIPPASQEWLDGLSDSVHAKLAKDKTVLSRNPVAAAAAQRLQTLTVADLIDEWVGKELTKTGAKCAPATTRKRRSETKKLRQHYADVRVADFDDDHADRFAIWIRQREVSAGNPVVENTVRGTLKVIKAMFHYAIRRKYVEVNPFERFETADRVETDRIFEVPAAWTQPILDACPSSQWRLMFLLWRMCALRKTEVYQLTWRCVLWERGLLRVDATKTRKERLIPIYGPIMQELQTAAELCPNGASDAAPIIHIYRASNTNLDKPFGHIVQNAGFTLWPKLFQNMRSTRVTEWLELGIPRHVVAHWAGHSMAVQEKHYAHVFARMHDRFREELAAAAAMLGADVNIPAEAVEHVGGEV